jgi:hypothetical protein
MGLVSRLHNSDQLTTLPSDSIDIPEIELLLAWSLIAYKLTYRIVGGVCQSDVPTTTPKMVLSNTAITHCYHFYTS